LQYLEPDPKPIQETILLVRPSLRLGSSPDFDPDLSAGVIATAPEIPGSIATVVVTAAVCKNLRLVNKVFILFTF
jgi:hypothetical protein